jgi:ubiquinone/menaquinone biosynthesis C-methylase UbiE
LTRIMLTDEPKMQKYYAARAPEYDEVYRKPERQQDLRAIEHWLPPLFTGATVLEVACGTGYWTSFIAQTARRILAVDAAPETMRLAQDRVTADKVTFVTGDAYQLPTHLGRFSAAFAGFWFSHVPRSRRIAFLRGVHAVLEPGAKFVLLDNRYIEGSSTPIAESDAEGNTYQTRTLKDGSTHRVLKNFPSEDELQSMIAGLGENGRFTVWPYYWAFEYAAV